MMEWFIGFLLAGFFCIIFYTAPFTYPKIWLDRLKGYKYIYIKGVSSAIKGDIWTANAITDPFGDFMAWRYPGTRTGAVTLREDGTGYYCGEIVWRYV